MTVKETLISSQEQAKPWIETPLKESYALSQAAGWYGQFFHISIKLPHLFICSLSRTHF
jgi:hypothetical protein